jgi:hypothetical protein
MTSRFLKNHPARLHDERTALETLLQTFAPSADPKTTAEAILASDWLTSHDLAEERAARMNTRLSADVRPSDMAALRQWLERPNGSHGPESSRGLVTFDAVVGGGILVRTKPWIART